MKSRNIALVIAGALFVVACGESPVSSEPTALSRHGSIAFNAEAAEGNTYLVRFKSNDIPADFATSVAALGGEVIFAHAAAGIAAVSGITDSGADGLAGRADIASVVADAVTILDRPAVAPQPVDQTMSANAPATALYFGAQWNMRQIRADVAWAAGKLGSPATKVGILDTGLGYTHIDLQGRVDLASSASFLSAAENQRVQDAFPGAHPVADLHYHGTHVGATVASNAVLAAGVSSGTQLVGLKVCAPGEPNVDPNLAWVASCPISATIGAVLYAADIGLPIINMSLGGLTFTRFNSSRGGLGGSLGAIINYVFHYAHKNGTQIVVAAGNNGIDLQSGLYGLYGLYCDAPDVICVSATGPTASGGFFGPWINADAVAGYSNTGKNHITVAAPGGTNAGIIWAACSRHSLALPFCQPASTIIGLGGTSMASPHVAGLAALIAAEGGHTPASITNRIIATADDLGPKGKDAGYGSGRINVLAGTQ